MPRIYVRKEARKRNMRLRVAAGLFDFVGIIVGVIVIIAAIILLRALIAWIISELTIDLSGLWKLFMNALIIPES